MTSDTQINAASAEIALFIFLTFYIVFIQDMAHPIPGIVGKQLKEHHQQRVSDPAALHCMYMGRRIRRAQSGWQILQEEHKFGNFHCG